MSIVMIFSGAFCNEESVVDAILTNTRYKPITDRDVVKKAAENSKLDEQKLERALSAKTSIFNKFTHEKERAVAFLKLSLAEILLQDNLLVQGFAGQLIPRSIEHALRVCLIGDMSYRVSLASRQKNLTEKDALKTIHRLDEDYAAWVDYLHRNSDPWDPALYDLVVPMDKRTPSEAVELIEKYARNEAIKTTEASERALRDFYLAALTEIALGKEGHEVDVQAEDGKVTLIINKNVLLLSRLEEDLKAIVTKVPGVKSVETKVGKGFYQADIYRRVDFELPSRVLLVDDEREFVETLSERLIMRDMGSAVVYDGQSALDFVQEEEPDVMILDLKMPGIDGIEVLRRVKKSNPNIEIIILTGHGSDEDRETCMSLGAFAYLQKPVDIDELSATLKKAHDKVGNKIA